MKKRSAILLALFSFFLLSLSAYAVDAPTVYGLVKKELKYITQDSEANARTVYGPKDVDGFETRFGVKGFIPTGELKAGYNLEVGFNSQLDNSNAERIRVRLANLSLGNDTYGTMTAGQAYLPGMIRNILLDPLVATAVEMEALDWAPIVGSISGANGKVPYLPRSPWQDLIAYESPSFGGLKLAISHDKNQQEYALRGTSVGNTGHTNGENWWTYGVYFDKAFSDIKLSATAAYATQEADGVQNEDQDKYWNLHAKVIISKATLGGGYYEYKVDRNVTNKMWLVLASFDVLPELTLSATFFKTTLSSYGSSFTTGVTQTAINSSANADIVNSGARVNGTDGEQHQFAAGLIYKFNPNVSAHAVLGFYNRKWNVFPGIFEKSSSKRDNSATQAATGLTIYF
ncbi:MAG: porin [Oligoflexia bacterium]|nr:porin [Oligoflexia bacterium]